MVITIARDNNAVFKQELITQDVILKVILKLYKKIDC